MDRPRLIRGLRIAVSAVCGILCVLLIVLWVRSYFNEDRASAYISSVGVRLYSSRGWLVCFRNNATSPEQYPWQISLGEEYWLEPSDSRLQFALPNDFFSSAATANISLPHWGAVWLCAAIATCPWLLRSTRFSLRTLLIATTLIAVVLGLMEWGMR